jgi:NAD(P)H-nitrite reductase large subunit
LVTNFQYIYTMTQKKYLIIGNSAGGLAAMRTLRKLDPHASIMCVSDEKELPYNKCFIADYVAGAKTEPDVVTLTDAMIAQLNMQMLLGTRVVAIVSDNKKVMLSSGKWLAYDVLLIATGSRAVLPPIQGLVPAANIIPFATYADAERVRSQIAQGVRHAVVIGAGLSGLEVADALAARGVNVTVIEQGAYPLARHVNAAGAQLIAQSMQQAGVTLLTATTVSTIVYAEDRAVAIVLADGREIKLDLLVIAAGMRQNSELAQDAGIACDAQGIIVNEYMQTSVTDIYAVGDVIGVYDKLRDMRVPSCTWPDAMQQGMHAAYAMHGTPKAYSGADILVSSAFFGLKFVSCGPIESVPETYTCSERAQSGMYHRYLMHQGFLKGFILVGATQMLPKLRRALLLQEPIEL